MAKTTIEIVENEHLTLVDGQTGEVLSDESKEKKTTKTVHNNEPPYIKIYITDMLYLSDMPTSLNSLMYSLLKRAKYANEGLRVDLSGLIKKEISKECGWTKIQTLDNALLKLTKGKILRRLGSGAYQFNPYLFGKGDWKDIDNIRVDWHYDEINGRTVQTYINYRKKTN